MPDYTILHHGAFDGVTGSCHQLKLADGRSLLVDCGLFQGAELSAEGSASSAQQAIDFPLTGVQALVVTHVHIDHVGRIPYLLAAGFRGPIYCSEASAALLPLVLEDALKVGVTRDERLIRQALQQVAAQVVALPYKQWHIVFSGDLGAPYTPLLPAPQSPWRADEVVLESTYGDRNHLGRAARVKQLKAIVERALRNRGTLIIPAFSIGRTQELLYELENIIARHGAEAATSGLPWQELDIVVDSPLAAKMTEAYQNLRQHWDAEAKRRLAQGRHPLAFAQLLTVDSHENHLILVDYLKKSGRPAIVIAASGMCAGGRVMNYLKALLADARTDVLFVGYQAAGTPGALIQKYGPRGGYVDLDGERITIRAGIHTLSSYSAHADQKGLLHFVQRIRCGAKRVRLVHGDAGAKAALRRVLVAAGQDCPIA